MDLPYRVSVRIGNRQRMTRQVGNKLLRGRSYAWVDFGTTEELMEAMKSAERGQIQFFSKVPEDILKFLNLPVTTDPSPAAPIVPKPAPQPTPEPSPVQTNKTATFSGNYNDLTNKPTIPTNVSQLKNDAGYITRQAAFSGNYNDLTNKPTIPTNLSHLKNDMGWVNSDTVKGIKVLTLAEYNALPDVKNADAILYLVKEGI